jgi:uncharacterized repeat protein (TIGR03803 family)
MIALPFIALVSPATPATQVRSVGSVQESTIYSFPGPPDSEGPGAGPPTVILKLGRDFYGVAYGGPYSASAGTVWKLQPDKALEEVLYDFPASGTDASHPEGNLVADSAGALYGVSYQGGNLGLGTVFRLEPHGRRYTESVLYSFQGTADGENPNAIAIDANANLYVTAPYGGASGAGTILKLAPSASGYNPTVIYSFNGADGYYPNTITANADGSLYGTVSDGGEYASGAIFKLTPTPSGYAYSPVYEFEGHYDGSAPSGFLTVDRAGRIFGVTYNGGGPAYLGTVYSVEPTQHGYRERVLYAFQGGTDGQNPYAGVSVGRDGTIYGTTYLGGAGGDGTIFELMPTGHGTYAKTDLHDFAGYPSDGQSPISSLLLDSGAFYGLTFWGGIADRGILFRFTP